MHRFSNISVALHSLLYLFSGKNAQGQNTGTLADKKVEKKTQAVWPTWEFIVKNINGMNEYFYFRGYN